MSNTKNKNHNGIISFWKFAFCVMIIALHLSVSMKQKYFLGGSIGVEFFFIVSGYLLGKAALNEKNDNIGEKTNSYIMKKVKRLFPYMLFSWLFAMVLFVNTNEIPYAKHDIINSIWDIMFLKNSGMVYRTFLGVSWYISAMLICMIGLYPLVLKYKKSFVYIIAPLIVILIGGYIANKYRTIAYTGDYMVSLLRALFELSLGVIVYNVSEKIKKVNFKKITKVVLTLCEFIGFASILFLVNLENAHVKYDFIMILIISLSTCIAFSEITYDLKIFNNKFFYFLEKLSLPMYLNQYFIFGLMSLILKNKFYDIPFYLNLIIAVIASILISLIIMGLVKIYDCLIKKISKIFINSEVEVRK